MTEIGSGTERDLIDYIHTLFSGTPEVDPDQKLPIKSLL